MRAVGYSYDRKLYRSRAARLVYRVVGVLLLTATALFLYQYVQIYRGPIPADIYKKINYDIYLPAEGSTVVEPNSYKFTDEERVLTYALSYAGTRITLSQQPEPEIFDEGPVYQHLLNKMHQYEEVKVNMGTVTLTRPEELKGGQTAVMRSQGTLFFARPDKDLSSKEWQAFFDVLEEAK
jgi:hypothetical protein